jgi:glycyl-tRNA synthetase beta chain
MVKIIADANWDLDLSQAIDFALSAYTDLATVDLDEARTAIAEFIADRVRRWLVDVVGVSGDTADAVMGAGWNELPATIARAEALEDVRGSESFRALSLAFKRVRNITDGHELGEIDSSLFELPAENELYDRITVFHSALNSLLSEHRVREAYQAMEPIAESLDQIFIDVLVMAKDERVRCNRIALLKTLGQDFLTLADLSKLQIEGDDS